MDNHKNIQNELKDLNSSLAGSHAPTPFSVPTGYFDGLAAQILVKVNAQHQSAAGELQTLSPLLAGLSKQSPYTVPNGYFNENLVVLPSLQSEVEIAILATVSKELPYTVPDGYFEQMPQQILASLTHPKAKVVPFFSRTWTRAAVAAMIGGIIFFGGYRLLYNPEETMPAVTAQHPADTTEKLVAKNQTSLVHDIKNISAGELEEFMKIVPYHPNKTQKSVSALTEKKEVKEMLKDVSEKEIEAFLEAIPTADENLLITD